MTSSKDIPSPRVLIIEDDRIFRIVAVESLKSKGMEMLQAEDARTGLEVYYRNRPDAVLLDLGLPDMSGLEVLERLVEEDDRLPVIVVSAGEDLHRALEALRQGAWDYVLKTSESPDTLHSVLERHLADARDYADKAAHIKKLQHEVDSLVKARRRYREKTEEQAREKRQLAEELEEREEKVNDMTVTLRNVIHTVDQEKEEIRSALTEAVRSSILPNLEKMAREESPEVRHTFLEVIRDQLMGLAKGEQEAPDEQLMILTPTELGVAQYIKVGRSSGEIADLMNSSLETIQTHRKNIRKKFDLVGKNISLQVFLRSIKGL